MLEDYIIIHIFYYFLIWTSIIVPLAVFSIAYGRTENQWQAGAIDLWNIDICHMGTHKNTVSYNDFLCTSRKLAA